MLSFSNIEFNYNELQNTDLFICSIGYESRSLHLFNIIDGKVEDEKFLVFTINNNEYNKATENTINSVKSSKKHIYNIDYADYHSPINHIFKAIKDVSASKNHIRIDVDYSSMPRSWYCQIVLILNKVLRQNDCANFWYSEGIYPTNYKDYPTAGIESYRTFFGKPSLSSCKDRVHLIALSYDTIRTQGIISLLDPEYTITCEAHNNNEEIIKKNIFKANSMLIDKSAINISFDIKDMEYMIIKLKETVNEHIYSSDVIIIPDGPKPLILAMSIVSILINKEGVTCLHIKRNLSQFKPIDIKALGSVIGLNIRITNLNGPNNN